MKRNSGVLAGVIEPAHKPATLPSACGLVPRPAASSWARSERPAAASWPGASLGAAAAGGGQGADGGLHGP